MLVVFGRTGLIVIEVVREVSFFNIQGNDEAPNKTGQVVLLNHQSQEDKIPIVTTRFGRAIKGA